MDSLRLWSCQKRIYSISKRKVFRCPQTFGQVVYPTKFFPQPVSICSVCAANSAERETASDNRMWRKTKALPADPHCSYRCSTVGTLSLLRHSHTGNSAEKTPRIFGDQIPKWQTKQFSDLWNSKNSTFPVWVFRVTLKEMLFESAHYVGDDSAKLYCELLECSWNVSEWIAEKLKIAIVYTLLCHLKPVWFYIFFPLKEVKEYSCDSFNSAAWAFFRISLNFHRKITTYVLTQG